VAAAPAASPCARRSRARARSSGAAGPSGEVGSGALADVALGAGAGMMLATFAEVGSGTTSGAARTVARGAIVRSGAVARASGSTWTRASRGGPDEALFTATVWSPGGRSSATGVGPTGRPSTVAVAPGSSATSTTGSACPFSWREGKGAARERSRASSSRGVGRGASAPMVVASWAPTRWVLPVPDVTSTTPWSTRVATGASPPGTSTANAVPIATDVPSRVVIPKLVPLG
jgi:hypothetical protein